MHVFENKQICLNALLMKAVPKNAVSPMLSTLRTVS